MYWLPLWLTLCALDPSWSTVAPAQLPPVTVRWEDPAQREVMVVEGARYRCRVATATSSVLSLTVDGRETLGAKGLSVCALDDKGQTWSPAPADVTPIWRVWQSGDWRRASEAKPRMNVFSASPYYWDAHLVDIPLITSDMLARYRRGVYHTLTRWDFGQNEATGAAPQTAGWRKPHDCSFAVANADQGAPQGALRLQLHGRDPYLSGPECRVVGPLDVVIRMRTTRGGGGNVYWSVDDGKGVQGAQSVDFRARGDGEWHECHIYVPETRTITMLRLDPPGENGAVDVAWIRVDKADPVDGLAPMRGELVFHAQPDRLAIEFRLGEPGFAECSPTVPTTARWTFDGTPTSAGQLGDRPMARLETAATVLGVAGCRADGAPAA